MENKEKNEQQEQKKDKRKFNYGKQLAESALIQDSEEKIIAGLNGLQNSVQAPVAPSEPPIAPEPTPMPQTARNAVRTSQNEPQAQPLPQNEPTKGVQAWLPISLYKRIMMQKMVQGKSLKTIMEEALRMWVSVQENK